MKLIFFFFLLHFIHHPPPPPPPQQGKDIGKFFITEPAFKVGRSLSRRSVWMSIWLVVCPRGNLMKKLKKNITRAICWMKHMDTWKIKISTIVKPEIQSNELKSNFNIHKTSKWFNIRIMHWYKVCLKKKKKKGMVLMRCHFCWASCIYY